MNLGTHRAYLPENLDLSQIDKHNLDNARWFCGSLYSRDRLWSKHDRPKDDYYRYSSRELQETLPHRTYRSGTIDRVKDLGIVEENESYQASGPGSPIGYCKGFRLSEKYCHDRFKAVTLSNPRLLRKLERKRQANEWAYNADVHRHLRRMVKRLELSADWPTVSLPLSMLANQDHWFTVCRQGRVHTLLTALKRDLRQYLRFDGKKLHCIDITNSQPLLLGLTLRNNRLLKSNDFRTYVDVIKNRYNTQTTANHNQPTDPNQGNSHYVRTFDRCLSDGDLNDYIGLCLSGQVYEAFMDLTGYDRDRVKELFLATIYGEPSNEWAPYGCDTTKTGRAFSNRFPELWQRILAAKGRARRDLPCLMQTIESYAVIWRTCGRVMREMPTAPLLTIHDSLVTTAEYIDAFNNILIDEFRQVFDIEPKTKVKGFAKPY